MQLAQMLLLLAFIVYKLKILTCYYYQSVSYSNNQSHVMCVLIICNLMSYTEHSHVNHRGP